MEFFPFSNNFQWFYQEFFFSIPLFQMLLFIKSSTIFMWWIIVWKITQNSKFSIRSRSFRLPTKNRILHLRVIFSSFCSTNCNHQRQTHTHPNTSPSHLYTSPHIPLQLLLQCKSLLFIAEYISRCCFWSEGVSFSGTGAMVAGRRRISAHLMAARLRGRNATAPPFAALRHCPPLFKRVAFA